MRIEAATGPDREIDYRLFEFVRTDAETIDSGPDTLPAAPADPVELAALTEELGIGGSVGRLATALGWELT